MRKGSGHLLRIVKYKAISMTVLKEMFSQDDKRVGTKLEERVRVELKSADNEEIFSVLSIGQTQQSHLKLQKMVFILSKLFGDNSKAVAYKFGPFDEYLMEKIKSSDQPFIKSESGKFQLTELGELAFPLVREKIASRRPELVEFADTLRKMSDRDIIAVVYYLFPDFAAESEIKEDVSHEIERILRSKKIFDVTRQEEFAGRPVAHS